MKTILVTGIGGGVGQGILRNIRDLHLDIKVIGVNVEEISAGNHLCDNIFKVPYAYLPDYISTIKEIIIKNEVDLIIPSTDYESYYLGLYKDDIPCKIACSPFLTTGFCLDKYLNYQAFAQQKIPFAYSILPADYNNEFEKYIVKPREGRGSRDIHLNPLDPSRFSDKYIIQEYLEGKELTTTAYINKRKELHGSITMVRELELGTTTKCEVVFEYDQEINTLIQQIISSFEFSGSFNIQSRVTSKGIIPFEINCRISGTNSIRSQFGFNDVGYTIQEYLYNEEPELPQVKKGSALRIMLDVIYPEISLEEISNSSDKYYIN